MRIKIFASISPAKKMLRYNPLLRHICEKNEIYSKGRETSNDTYEYHIPPPSSPSPFLSRTRRPLNP